MMETVFTLLVMPTFYFCWHNNQAISWNKSTHANPYETTMKFETLLDSKQCCCQFCPLLWIYFWYLIYNLLLAQASDDIIRLLETGTTGGGSGGEECWEIYVNSCLDMYHHMWLIRSYSIPKKLSHLSHLTHLTLVTYLLSQDIEWLEHTSIS